MQVRGADRIRRVTAQGLALFDLDNTLINLEEAFQAWAGEFADEHGLGCGAVNWPLALERVGYPHREVFFIKARDHFALREPFHPLAASAGHGMIASLMSACYIEKLRQTGRSPQSRPPYQELRMLFYRDG
jgi:FMN phosphatase YigB (HAD superfamily)